ncbi:extracellular solute-binding protein, family 5, partial [Thaumarchaeota archaeon SCGC AB-539-E09]
YAPILPKHIYEGTDIINNPHNWDNPIGTGPFILDEWVRGSYIKLARNPDYWQKDKPYLDEVIFSIIPDESTRLLAFENKELDYIAWDLPLEELERLNNTEGINVVDCSAFGSQHQILFNLQNEYLSNKDVRHAIAYALDKELINELVTEGFYTVATGPVPYSSWAYNPNVNKYEYNKTLSEALLDEAGYPKDSEGNRFDLEVIVGPTGQGSGIKEAEIMRSMLEEVGINLDIRIYDEATTANIVNIEHTFDMYIIAGLSTAPDPNMISGYLHSSRIFLENPIPGLWNLMVYNNSRIDELFDTGLSETDFETRKEIYWELQEIIVDDLPCIWLIAESGPHFYWEDYVGVPAGPYGGARERLDDVWWTGGVDVSRELILEAISDAEQEIAAAAEEDYDVSAATAKLDEAKAAYEAYEYIDAQTFITEAIELLTPPPARTPIELYAAAVAVLIAVAVFVWYKRK